MGIPKFYRWISERYPCLSEVVKEHQIPEFDCLYLDMNGIIHQCSHPNDDDPHFRISEEKIFKDIFHYIEILFRMIKPKRSFFMAVDGVAPRAKMNQQRGRRFRAAKCAEDAVKEALEKGEDLPAEERFDSNCITPGTGFMAKLQEQLKYFVTRKMTEDRSWHGVDVYLSGHDCPGEGEHKIMDFIRWKRSHPDYDPNTRHCLYGLDADLIMLGLSSHDPRFSLLREEVRFGKQAQSKRITAPEETTFHLLHLGLMREYIEMEFADISVQVTHFDIDKLIDDWILMAFLVGNDFIPHLPHLHIHQDALTILFGIYKKVMPKLKGYINEGGRLNLERFQTFMEELGKWDEDTFRDEWEDLSWLEGKKAMKGMEENSKNESKKQKTLESAAPIDTSNPFAMLDKQRLEEAMAEDPDEELEDFGFGSPQIVQRVGELPGGTSAADLTDEEMFQMEFAQHKSHYYMDKMGFKEVTPVVLHEQAVTYVTAIQWNLLYYYDGCSSWGWFYPHHYAPFASDIKGFKHLKIEFEFGKPFLPFQQLLAVLPPYSKKHLPSAYHSLMTEPTSPVIDFYPTNFDLDLNGKQQDWEAVVCIPFIEERRLLAAMSTVEGNLQPEERRRNCHGPALLYQYSKTSLGLYKSSLPGALPDIKDNHAAVTPIPRESMLLPGRDIIKGAIPNPRRDVYFPGFPTMRHLDFTFRLKKDNVKVFQQPSRGETMCLLLKDFRADATVDAVADICLGRVVFVCWPHLQEALVVGVCDGARRIALREKNSKPVVNGANDNSQNGNSQPSSGLGGSEIGCVANLPPDQRIKVQEDLTQNENHKWQVEANQLSDRYKDRFGIDVGPMTAVTLYVCPLVGRKYVMHSGGTLITLQKQWASVAVASLWQTTLADLKIQESCVTKFTQVEELYSQGSTVFMLGSPHYGSEGTVKEIDQVSGRVRVAFQIVEEPDLNQIIRDQRRLQLRYMPGYVAAQQLSISPHLISRITGSIYIARHNEEKNTEQKINIGLNLKFSKRNKEIPGFTRKSNNNGGVWEYSEKAVEIIGDYMDNFPEVFNGIARASNSDVYDEDTIWSGLVKSRLQELQNWLKEAPCHGIEQTPCGTERLDEGIIRAIEQEVDAAIENADDSNRKAKKVVMRVRPHLLHRPLGSLGISQIPDPAAAYGIFDRIVNVREGYSVPLGLRGTVVGVTQAIQEADRVYEVLFDREFMGGLSARASGPRIYRLPLTAMINLSHGQRREPAAFQVMRPTAVVHPVNSVPAHSENSFSYPREVSRASGVWNKKMTAVSREDSFGSTAPGAYPNDRGGNPSVSRAPRGSKEKTTRKVEIVEKVSTSMKPKIDIKDLFSQTQQNKAESVSVATLAKTESKTDFDKLIQGLSNMKTKDDATDEQHIARKEQSDMLKKILNIQSKSSDISPLGIPTAANVSSSFSASSASSSSIPSTGASSPPNRRSENVAKLEDYLAHQMKVKSKPRFEVLPGPSPGTHVAVVTVDCLEGPMTLRSEPKQSTDFAVDVAASMALQTLMIKNIVPGWQMAQSASAGPQGVSNELETNSARLLPSPGSAFTAVQSPQQQFPTPPRLYMQSSMPPPNTFIGLPARMLPITTQHQSSVPHLSFHSDGIFKQPPPATAVSFVPGAAAPVSFPGSYPWQLGMTRPIKDPNLASVGVSSRQGGSGIPPLFVPLQVSKKNRARDRVSERDSTEEREAVPALHDHSQTLASGNLHPALESAISTNVPPPVEGYVPDAPLISTDVSQSDQTNAVKVKQKNSGSRRSKKKSRVAANFGGAES